MWLYHSIGLWLCAMLKLDEIEGSYSNCSPLYISVGVNPSFYIVAYGRQIQVIGQSSGTVFGSFRCHQATVTSILISNDLNEEKHQQTKDRLDFPTLLSSSVDGSLYSWSASFDSSTRLKFNILHQWNIQLPIYHLWLPKYDAGSEEPSLISLTSKKRSIAQDSSNKHSSLKSFEFIFFIISVDAKNQFSLKKVEIINKQKIVVQTIVVLPPLSPNCSYSNSIGDISIPLGDGIPQHQYLIIAVKRELKFIPVFPPSVEGIENKSLKLSNLSFTSHAKESITSLATNAERGLLVTGHANGEIRVWHGLLPFIRQRQRQHLNGTLLDQDKVVLADLTFSHVHWHSQPVSTLRLSKDGLNLLSGGQEAVLVSWRLSSGQGSTLNAADRSFLPRLGAPIVHISNTCCEASGGLRVAVSTADNCIHGINITSLGEEWSLRSLCLPGRAEAYDMRLTDKSWKSSLIVDSRSGYLLVNGNPAELQCFDPLRNYCVDSFQILSYSRVSAPPLVKDNLRKHRVLVPAITLFRTASYHTFGHVLVTVQVQRTDSDPDAEAVSTLKFWQWVDVLNTYALVTEVNDPHRSSPALSGCGGGRVTDLCLSPCCYDESDGISHPLGVGAGSSYLLCASAADDGGVKIWKGVSARKDSHSAAGRSGVTSLSWLSLFTFRYRETPAAGLGFSGDGSLLSVAYGNVVTLWDPNSVQLKASFLSPTPNNIVFCAFVEPSKISSEGGGGAAYLVLASKRSISVVNLLDLKLVWTKSVPGSFTAWAVATTGEDCLSLPSSTAATPEEGWIAVGYCSRRPKVEKGKRKVKEVGNSKDGKVPSLVSSGKHAISQECTVDVAEVSSAEQIEEGGDDQERGILAVEAGNPNNQKGQVNEGGKVKENESDKLKEKREKVEEWEWSNEVWVFGLHSARQLASTPRQKQSHLGRVTALAFLPSAATAAALRDDTDDGRTGKNISNGSSTLAVLTEDASFLLCALSVTDRNNSPPNTGTRAPSLPSLQLDPTSAISSPFFRPTEDKGSTYLPGEGGAKSTSNLVQFHAPTQLSSSIVGGDNQHRSTATVFERYLQLTLSRPDPVTIASDLKEKAIEKAVGGIADPFFLVPTLARSNLNP